MRYRLFLDDEREPPAGRWVIARSVAEAKLVVEQKGFPEFISFDHDLGEEPNAMAFVHYLIDLDLDTNRMPEGFQFVVHSQNPVGAGNITGLLDCYLRTRM